MRLDLVIPGDHLGVAGGRRATVTGPNTGILRLVLVLVLLVLLGGRVGRGGRGRGGGRMVGAVVHVGLGRAGLVVEVGVLRHWHALLPPVGVDEDVDAAVAALGIVQALVLVVGLGVFGDDVPGMEEAGQIAEGGEEDVDEGIRRAQPALYPDCEGRKEDGQEAEEDVGGAHISAADGGRLGTRQLSRR